jgi:hypothetical protein
MTVKALFDSEKKDLQNFIEENLKDGVAVPHPDDLFDAVENGHYEISRFRTKSGNPEVWFGHSVTVTTRYRDQV